MFGYQGQERVSANGNGNSKWYNFQLRMYNPALGRFNTIDPYSQFNSPYLAMANNPISFVDPDGGRAIFSEAHKQKLMRDLMGRLLKGEYYGRPLEFLRIWEAISGQQYHGLNADEVYAFGVQYGYDAMIGRFGLNEMFNGGLAPGGPNSMGNGPQMNAIERPGEGGKYIDGLKVSDFAYSGFVDNTLREDIVDYSSNSVGFTQKDGIWDPTHNEGKDIFGEGKTNREVRESQNRVNRIYKKLKKMIYKLKKANNALKPKGPFLSQTEETNWSIMGGVAYVINQNGVESFINYVDDPNYGTDFFINAIENTETAISNYLPDYLNFGLKAAAWGQKYFRENDELRHIIASFLTAEKYGLDYSMKVTTTNEFYGFFRHDIPDLKARMSGQRPWAFQLHDFKNNGRGYALWLLWKNNR